MQEAIRKLCENNVDTTVIANSLGVPLESVQVEYSLVHRQRDARRFKKKYRDANTRSVGWATPKPETGNLVPVRAVRARTKRPNRTVTQVAFGDPSPFHIAVREARR